MSIFQKRFFTLLEQDEQQLEPAGNQDQGGETSDADALASTLDKGTNPDDLGANVSSDAARAISEREQKMVAHINNWVSKLSEFTTYLNGTEDGSMQSTLKNAEPDTILDKIRITETKKIARAATDLASLVETLKGYLATSRDPKYRYQ